MVYRKPPPKKNYTLCHEMVYLINGIPTAMGNLMFDNHNILTECRAKILPLSYWSTLYTSDAKLTSHGKCVAN